VARNRLLWAVIGYLLVRAVGVAVLLVALDGSPSALLHALGDRYDAQWLVGVAEHGYDDGETSPSNLAFPLFPFLARVFGVVGLPLGAVLVSWLAGAAAAAGIYAVGSEVASRSTAVVLAVLWGVLPHAITQSMAYTESLFAALAAWSLWAMLRRRWLTASLFCALAGLCRATGWVLVVVLFAVILHHLWRRRDAAWRPWIALLIAPCGWFAYVLWVAVRTGDPLGWFAVQQGWGTRWDGGAFTVRTLYIVLADGTKLQYVVVALTLLASVALWCWCLVQRQSWPLLLFSLLVLVTAIGAGGYFHSKARLILPAFPLLLPVAAAMVRLPLILRILAISVLAVLSGAFGAYLLTLAPYSP